MTKFNEMVAVCPYCSGKKLYWVHPEYPGSEHLVCMSCKKCFFVSEDIGADVVAILENDDMRIKRGV